MAREGAVYVSSVILFFFNQSKKKYKYYGKLKKRSLKRNV